MNMSRTSCEDHPGYVSGCGGCQAVARVYSARRYEKLRAGQWELMLTGDQLDAPRRALLELIRRPGVTVPRIAAAIGIAGCSLYRLKNGRTKRLQAYVGRALLDLAADTAVREPTSRLVDAVGVVRRLRALARDGWSAARLSELSGIHPETLTGWRRGRRVAVSPANHQRVAQLYDKIRALADPRGGDRAAELAAERRGWEGPESWDVDTIDDPRALPLPDAPDTDDHVTVTALIEDALRVPHGGKAADYERPVKREIARHAINRLGWTHEQAAWLLGYKSASTVEYLLRGRPDRPHTRQEKTP